MVRIQCFLRQLQIKIILSKLAPGQGEQCIDIATNYSSLGRHRRHLHKAIKLLVQLGLHVLGQLELGNLALVLGNFALHVFGLAQLLANSLNLLSQVIFLLVLLYLLVHLLGNMLSNGSNLAFSGQKLV